jgi:hypothetical protein
MVLARLAELTRCGLPASPVRRVSHLMTADRKELMIAGVTSIILSTDTDPELERRLGACRRYRHRKTAHPT